MKRFLFLLLFIGLSIFTNNLSAQTSQPGEPPPFEDDVVKITTTLVQMDVVVTDKKGNQATGLDAADFEIFVNGKKQDITNFSYIEAKSKSKEITKEERKQNKYSVPPPPSKLRLEKVRRTYAIVIDDLGLSFSSVPAVRQDVRKFINEEMREDDLVAIVRTGSGIGALQSFTNNKQQLLAAVDKIRWNPQGRGGINYYEPIQNTFQDDLNSIGKGSSRPQPTTSTDNDAEIKDAEEQFKDQIAQFRNENFSVGTLGGLNYVIRGMRELPGRKAVMFFSEGFPLVVDRRSTRIFDLLKRLADIASRSSVVIYTFDPRGLVNPLAFGADEAVNNIFDGSAIARRDDRAASFRDSQQSLRYLAYETGGIPFVNQNDLTKGLREAIEDQSGYYLIAYQPDDESFDPKKTEFNKVEIKVKREGLNVRYRSGFFGIPDSKLETGITANQTAGQQIYRAIGSPFGVNDISLSLNTLFAEDEKNGTFIRSLVTISAKDLKFEKQNDGIYKANFDILAMTFGDNGVPVDETSKNYSIKVSEENYQRIFDAGFVYNLLVPIKKAGAYQFRVAIRDSATAKVGSASQFIEVPNLKKNRLTLSGIVLSNYQPSEWTKTSAGKSDKSVDSGLGVDTALRKFKRGTILRYDYVIYNARTNPSDIVVRARLFRNGQLFLEGTPSPFDTKEQRDLERMEASGAITLGQNLDLGDYVLQIIVEDKLAKKRQYQNASNWIDFQIVE